MAITALPATALHPERLAESAEDALTAMRRISTGVVHPGVGIVYPTFRVAGAGDFQFALGFILERANIGPGGLCCRAATTRETEMFELAVLRDHVSVVLLSRPGYGAGYGARSVLRVMHVSRGRWAQLTA